MTKRFTKKKENFTCDNCSTAVVGDGYTNHCPSCLWSKHVDIMPGDRSSDCEGMMRPMLWDQKKGEERLVHRCMTCGYTKTNRIADNDDREVLVKIAQGRDF